MYLLDSKNIYISLFLFNIHKHEKNSIEFMNLNVQFVQIEFI